MVLCSSVPESTLELSCYSRSYYRLWLHSCELQHSSLFCFLAMILFLCLHNHTHHHSMPSFTHCGFTASRLCNRLACGTSRTLATPPAATLADFKRANEKILYFEHPPPQSVVVQHLGLLTDAGQSGLLTDAGQSYSIFFPGI